METVPPSVSHRQSLIGAVSAFTTPFTMLSFISHSNNKSMSSALANPLFARITVPKGLEELLQEMAREILRYQPNNILLFAADYCDFFVKLGKKGLASVNLQDDLTPNPIFIVDAFPHVQEREDHLVSVRQVLCSGKFVPIDLQAYANKGFQNEVEKLQESEPKSQQESNASVTEDPEQQSTTKDTDKISTEDCQESIDETREPPDGDAGVLLATDKKKIVEVTTEESAGRLSAISDVEEDIERTTPEQRRTLRSIGTQITLIVEDCTDENNTLVQEQTEFDITEYERNKNLEGDLTQKKAPLLEEVSRQDTGKTDEDESEELTKTGESETTSSSSECSCSETTGSDEMLATQGVDDELQKVSSAQDGIDTEVVIELLPVDEEQEEELTEIEELEKLISEGNAEELSHAAVRLQSNFRGFQARKTLKPRSLSPVDKNDTSALGTEVELVVLTATTGNEELAKTSVVVEEQMSAVFKEEVCAVIEETIVPVYENVTCTTKESPEDNQAEIEELEKLIAEGDVEELSKAATQLQSNFRGFQVRKSLNSPWNEFVEENEIPKIEEESPTEVMGEVDENVDDAAKAEADEIEELKKLIAEGDVEELSLAATRLQANFRGFKSRKSVATPRNQSVEETEVSQIAQEPSGVELPEDIDGSTVDTSDRKVVDEGIELIAKEATEVDDSNAEDVVTGEEDTGKETIGNSTAEVNENIEVDTAKLDSNTEFLDDGATTEKEIDTGINTQNVDDSAIEVDGYTTKETDDCMAQDVAVYTIKADVSIVEETDQSMTKDVAEASAQEVDDATVHDIADDTTEADEGPEKEVDGEVGKEGTSQSDIIPEITESTAGVDDDTNAEDAAKAEAEEIEELKKLIAEGDVEELSLAATRLQANFRGFKSRKSAATPQNQSVEETETSQVPQEDTGTEVNGDKTEESVEQTEAEEIEELKKLIAEGDVEELSMAATRLQANFRGFKSRKSAVTPQNQSVEETETSQVPQEETGTEVNRDKTEETVEQTETEEIEELKKLIAEGDVEELSMAATRLQANFRGFKSRKSAATPQNQSVEETETSQVSQETGTEETVEQTEAEEIEELKKLIAEGDVEELSMAATRLQANFRGFKSRKSAATPQNQSVEETETSQVPQEETGTEVNGDKTEETVEQTEAEEIEELKKLIAEGDVEELSMAATRLQANFRGFKSRKSAATPRNQSVEETETSQVPQEETEDSVEETGTEVNEDKTEQSVEQTEAEEIEELKKMIAEGDVEELSMAATRLQANFRGFKARKSATSPCNLSTEEAEIIPEEIPVEVVIAEVEKSILTEDEEIEELKKLISEGDVQELSKAATRLQSNFRGFQTRKSINSPRNQSIEEPEPSSTSDEESKKEIAQSSEADEIEELEKLIGEGDVEELAKAATRLQSNFRGFKARKEIKSPRSASLVEEEELVVKELAKLKAEFRKVKAEKDSKSKLGLDDIDDNCLKELTDIEIKVIDPETYVVPEDGDLPIAEIKIYMTSELPEEQMELSVDELKTNGNVNQDNGDVTLEEIEEGEKEHPIQSEVTTENSNNLIQSIETEELTETNVSEDLSEVTSEDDNSVLEVKPVDNVELKDGQLEDIATKKIQNESLTEKMNMVVNDQFEPEVSELQETNVNVERYLPTSTIINGEDIDLHTNSAMEVLTETKDEEVPNKMLNRTETDEEITILVTELIEEMSNVVGNQIEQTRNVLVGTSPNRVVQVTFIDPQPEEDGPKVTTAVVEFDPHSIEYDGTTTDYLDNVNSSGTLPFQDDTTEEQPMSDEVVKEFTDVVLNEFPKEEVRDESQELEQKSLPEEEPTSKIEKEVLEYPPSLKLEETIAQGDESVLVLRAAVGDVTNQTEMEINSETNEVEEQSAPDGQEMAEDQLLVETTDTEFPIIQDELTIDLPIDNPETELPNIESKRVQFSPEFSTINGPIQELMSMEHQEDRQLSLEKQIQKVIADAQLLVQQMENTSEQEKTQTEDDLQEPDKDKSAIPTNVQFQQSTEDLPSIKTLPEVSGQPRVLDSSDDQLKIVIESPEIKENMESLANNFDIESSPINTPDSLDPILGSGLDVTFTPDSISEMSLHGGEKRGITNDSISRNSFSPDSIANERAPDISSIDGS